MGDGSIDLRGEARAEIYAEALERSNPARPDLFAGPQHTRSIFVRGYETLPVVIPRRT